MKTDEGMSQAKQTDLNVPMNAKKAISESQNQEEGKVVFALVTRKGNKTDVKALHVDQDSRLAQGLEAAERERTKKQEEMKNLTLSLAENLAIEEETAELEAAQKTPVENRNRERAKKYQHPKVRLNPKDIDDF